MPRPPTAEHRSVPHSSCWDDFAPDAQDGTVGDIEARTDSRWGRAAIDQKLDGSLQVTTS